MSSTTAFSIQAPLLVQLGLVLAALLAATKLMSAFVRRRRLAAAMAAVGGGPIPRLPSCDPFWGLDTSLALLKHLQDHTLLPMIESLMEKYSPKGKAAFVGRSDDVGDAKERREKVEAASEGERTSWTLRATVFGDDGVWTSDVENIRSVLATQARDWGVGQMRADAFDPLFGQNIVTSNGEVWQASRSIIRPNFARKQINDTERFERHYELFRAHLPRNPETVIDLGPLFYMLSMDVSSELL